jgi:hypothetical protein
VEGAELERGEDALVETVPLEKAQLLECCAGP